MHVTTKAFFGFILLLFTLNILSVEDAYAQMIAPPPPPPGGSEMYASLQVNPQEGADSLASNSPGFTEANCDKKDPAYVGGGTNKCYLLQYCCAILKDNGNPKYNWACNEIDSSGNGGKECEGFPITLHLQIILFLSLIMAYVLIYDPKLLKGFDLGLIAKFNK